MLGTGSPAGVAKVARSRVTNGKSLWLDGDKRGPAARRFRDIFAAIVSDLGGGDLVTEGQKQLARRCALLAVECEQIEARAVGGEEIDLQLYGEMTDRLGRAFQRLGLKRVSKDVTPSVEKYLAEAAARHAATEAAQCGGDGDAA